MRRAAAIFALLTTSCGTPAPPTAIDAAMSARVPPDAIAVAGVNLDQLRASPLFTKLPPAATAYLEPFRNSHSVLAASNGAEILTIARGEVAGAPRVAPGLALLGPPSLIAAATAPHAPAAILPVAEAVAAGHPIWLAVRGGAPLPLEGNLANLNNLVTVAEYMTLCVRLGGDAVSLELVARCPTPAAALLFEKRLRAVVSLSAAANPRQPAIAIHRDQQTVHATLTATSAALLP